MTLLTRRAARIGALSCAALLVAACAETQLGAQAVKEVARSDTRAEPSPVLAPEAFDATGLTIWDGASTLEGVWVAHPLAQRAQRVRVTNQENQIAVEGAMFRRDPTLSGPSILVSSDTARLLGLQPGVPTELRIVALREGVYAPPTATTATEQANASTAQAGDVETTALAAPEPKVDAEAGTDGDLETAEAASEDAADAAPAPAPVPETAAGDDAPIENTAEDTTAAPTTAAQNDAAPSAEQPTERKVTPPKSAITAADLRGETTVAATTPQAAQAPSEPSQPAPAQPTASQPAPAQPEPAQQVAAAAPVSEAPAAPRSSGAFEGQLPAGRFVQAGAFGVEPNAAALVQTLRGAGLPAQYVKREINGSALNIVMIGPLADEAAADAAIDAAAKAGAPGARKVIR